MTESKIDNMTIEELVGGASKQEIIEYFRNLGNKKEEPEELPTQVINNYTNTTNNNYSESSRSLQQSNSSNRDMRQQGGFLEQAKDYLLQLTVTDWILIVIALLLFINILVTMKYHD